MCRCSPLLCCSRRLLSSLHLVSHHCLTFFIADEWRYLEKLKELWVIPIFFTIVTSLSMTVGAILGWMFGLKRSQRCVFLLYVCIPCFNPHSRSFVMAAAMFMNSNTLPIALMQSLVVAVPDLAWGPDDNKNGMLGRALTYLTMYSTLGMVVRQTILRSVP